MSEINIDLLRKDECQPLTTEQMNDIKSQFHPSNTANVNIVPYHIYDEDGEEIKIGEVRKTIDGVKKKKPLYGKLFIFDTSKTLSDNNWNQNVLGTSGIEIKYSHTMCALVGYPTKYLAEGYYRGASEYITLSNEGSSLNIRPNMNAGATVYLDSCYIEYTKDSDTWQPV